MINLKCCHVDIDGSCLRLSDSKEGRSIRPIGLSVVEFLESRQGDDNGSYVFPGPRGEDTAFGGLPNHWNEIFLGSPLEGVTPHILHHSFASIGNDLGFTEVTIAALIGHVKGSVTSRYIYILNATLIRRPINWQDISRHFWMVRSLSNAPILSIRTPASRPCQTS